ncbi:Alpha-16-mannosylglycoprotein 6-beta-N-acetylglucosaminyltransferase A [Dissostichus eleginoides]|uniref:alpha-1,6-mannosyl-glycoprotein 6-beta-N-acetylglucosaminyltransferase n=1 Tax=Dissostichus eleginoides TaxID=100907 RepID=A0AAD9ETT4_DISEL|nr:Alpha-16-mannosylglycoprotein 6-beta-N-acetylglucosaminyltransferase A [Dissostichus eleginoides]
MATPFLWKLSSQKLGFFLVSFGFIWGMMLLHFTIQQRASHENSAVLRQQILDLSKRYIKALAEENQSVMDGPYVLISLHAAALDCKSNCKKEPKPVVYSYHLKKTLAVLLDNIMLRLGKLESKVENIYNSTGSNLTIGPGTIVPSATNSEKVNVADLLNGAQEKCELPPMEGFPHCEGKVTWMKDMWRSDSCYGNYGVDGSTCSYFIYLSEVENWCPRLPWRTKTLNEEIDRRGQAEVRTSFEELYRVMSAREEFRWMMLRIKRMADPWVSAIRSLASKQNLVPRRRKKGHRNTGEIKGGLLPVLVHLGLLTKESGFKIAENAFSGGPLGELVQWSDLITTLYLLGHDVRISASLSELKEIMRKVMGNKSSCPTQGDKVVELIYIDIVGLTQFKKTLGPSWVHYQCMLRVLDSFGTEPEFNHAHYAQAKGHKTPWGKWNLNPQQFNTMFPHTPDNSFLGFVVEQHLNASDIRHIDEVKRQNQSLVYGKVDNFWKNHGILSGRDLQFLLRESKLFAIANGCAFLNPKFTPAKSSKNTDFFKGKPTLRELTSQHPYAEVYVGQPHVWTVDIENPVEVENAIRSILSQKIEPYLPYEFTCEGMLQRVNAFIQNQDFCHGQVKLAEPGRSCKQVCQEEQLICEPSFFQHLNKDTDLARFGLDCQTVESSADTVVPAYSKTRRHCIFQSDLLLFSCAGSHSSLHRICPCRDYMKGQVALCKTCL